MGISKERYRDEKRRYRKLREGKKRKGRERCMKEEERRRRKRINERIEIKKLDTYFRELLGVSEIEED